ncbi:MAG: V-type ATP synthase subunit I [Bacillota bacterium]|nr:V-type ATP synthase subunit I [Bacillota bacterium]
MAIAEMRRITIIGHLADQTAVLQRLQQLGVVQIEEVSSTEEGALCLQTACCPDQAAAVEEKLSRLRYSLELIDRFHPPRKSFLESFTGARLFLSPREFERYVGEEERAEEVYQKARAIEERLTALRGREANLAALREVLLPWQGLDLPLEAVGATKATLLVLGMVSVRALAALQRDLAEEVPASYLEVIGATRDQHSLFLAYLKDDAAAVEKILRRHEFTPAALPSDLQGTPAQILARVEEELRALEREKAHAAAESERLTKFRPLLSALHDRLLQERDLLEAAARLGRTRSTFVLAGWARWRDVARLRSELAAAAPDAVLLDRPPEEGEVPPVDLDNAALVRPFEVVTRVSGLPAPGTVDPTPYLAPFFFLFFGLALGDAGYGVILSLLALWLMRRTHASGLGRQLLELLALGGVSSFLVGVLTGSWFGNLFGLPPLLFDPIKEPLKMLLLSFALGIVHIFTGLAVKGLDTIRRGQVWDALWDQGLWLVFLSGLILLLVSSSLPWPIIGRVGRYLALGGGVGLILTQGRSHKNPLKRLASGVLSLYGVSGYMSDVLSYSRLLALGLASGVIALVLNDVARRALGIPVLGYLVAAALLAGGHLFNLLINVVGAFVHSSRLQYVEFFTKFFQGGGRPFNPFRLRGKYTAIIKTEEV